MVRLEKNDPLMLARQLPLKTVALILAGGRGTRLKDLTIKRAKPAVHFGGKFRIIDFALSNCLNSGIRRIGVITQYQSHTLVQHIQRGWSFFSEEMNEFVDLLPAQQRVHGENWYRGTADAVTQNLDIIRRYNAEYIVILAGDHIYKQDYSHMLIDHVEKGARCTVACLPVPVAEATAFGVMHVDVLQIPVVQSGCCAKRPSFSSNPLPYHRLACSSPRRNARLRIRLLSWNSLHIPADRLGLCEKMT